MRKLTKIQKQILVIAVCAIFVGSVLASFLASDMEEELDFYMYGIASIDMTKYTQDDAPLQLCNEEGEYWVTFVMPTVDENGEATAYLIADRQAVDDVEVLRYNPETDENAPHVEMWVNNAIEEIRYYAIVIPEGYEIPNYEEYLALDELVNSVDEIIEEAVVPSEEDETV